MPNWCSNDLVVTGNSSQLKDFVSKSVKEDNMFYLDGLVPTPPILLQQTSPSMYRGDENDTQAKSEYEMRQNLLKLEYGFTDWYNWRVYNWGTKWDVSDSYVSVDEDKVAISFESAWSPPISWVHRVCEMYPDLKFELYYMEEGMGYCGKTIAENGELNIKEADIKYQDDNYNDVEYCIEKHKWMLSKTKQVIDDDDFYPISINPLA